jgi:signal transduction histidine kinase/CheY-like chemotaxis protein
MTGPGPGGDPPAPPPSSPLSPEDLNDALFALAEEAPDGIVLFAVEEKGGRRAFRRVYVNREAERVLGASRARLLGRLARQDARPPLGAGLVAFLSEVWNSRGRVERLVEAGSGAEPQIFLYLGHPLGDRVLGIRILDITDRELARREALRRERLLRGVAAAGERLLSRPWHEVLDEVLALLGTHADVSRVYVFRVRAGPTGHVLDHLKEWCAPGITPQLDNPGLTGLDLDAQGLGDWRVAFGAGRPVSARLGDAVPSVRAHLEDQEIHSLLCLPIHIGDRWWGAIGFDQCDHERAWSQGELEVLRSGAALLGAAVERELRLRELEAKDARLAAAVSASRDGFIIITLEGEPVEWNPVAAEILGSVPGEPIAPPDRVFPGLLDALAADPDADGWFEVEGHREGEARPFPAHVSVSAIRVESRDLLALVVRDLTEEKRMEERLWQMEKLDTVGRLAGGVAHDFNNLLTVIRGNADLALEVLNEGRAPEGELEEIARAAAQGARLTHQLLAFSRRQVMQRVPLDLSRIVRETASLIDPLIGDHIRVVLELSSPLPPVLADAGQMEQVLMNLVLNARDAMPAGGVLRIRTREAEEKDPLTGAEPGRWVLLEVVDDGVGMTPEVQRQIFEPFFTTKPQGEGTGLGLATVYGVIKQSQGEILVDSEPGRGTAVQILLPVHLDAGGAIDQQGETDAPRGRGLQPEGVSHGRATILVVGPEASTRRAARAALEGRGMRVLEARTAIAAETMLRESGGAVDLLLTDVVLPGVSGRRLADEATRIRPGLRRVFLSDYSREAMEGQGMIPEGSTVVEKPFSADAVVEAVERELGS